MVSVVFKYFLGKYEKFISCLASLSDSETEKDVKSESVTRRKVNQAQNIMIAELTDHFYLRCTICKLELKDVHEVRQHNRVIHKQRRTRFECRICSRQYVAGKYMTSHIEYHQKNLTLW